MPLYNFQCPECNYSVRKMYSSDEVEDVHLICPKCLGNMLHVALGASVVKKETLDNGLMARKVERPADVERLIEERSQAKEEPQQIRIKKP